MILKFSTDQLLVGSSDIETIYMRVNVMLESATKLTEINSVNITARNIKWNVRLEKKNNKLALYLQADESDLTHYYYKVDAIFKLLSFDTKVKPVIKTFQQDFRRGSLEYGFDEFLHWDDFISTDKKYIVKDKASLLVQFTVSEPKSLWNINQNSSKPAGNNESLNIYFILCLILFLSLFNTALVFYIILYIGNKCNVWKFHLNSICALLKKRN